MGKVQFKDFLKINKLKINDDLSNQSSIFYSYAQEHEVIEYSLKTAELNLEIIIDDLSRDFKNKYRNVKNFNSETTIKRLVGSNEEVKKLKREINELSHAYRKSKIRLDALKMRSEMLITLSNNIRGERKSGSFHKT